MQPTPPCAPRRRRWASPLAAGVLLAVMVVSIVAGESAALRAEAVYTTALAEYRAAEHSLLTRVTVLESAVQSLAAPLVVARDGLGASAGRVLDESARSGLVGAIADAETAVRAAAASAAEGRNLLSGSSATGAPNDLTRSREALTDAALAVPSGLLTAHETLRTHLDATTAAVAAWQSEQDRLAAEAAAREAAAAAAAAAAAEAEAVQRAQAATVASPSRSGSAGSTPAAPGGSATGTPAASAPAPAPAGHTEYVWTTGFQAELDACKGSVNMTPSFGTGVIGEHWSCGGSSFPRTEGAIVVLSGVMSGTFRVGPVVAVLNQRVDRIEDVPQGYELLYQTCLDGDNTRMSFTQLIRVG